MFDFETATPAEVLDHLAERFAAAGYGEAKDADLANMLFVTKAAVSYWRHGKRRMSYQRRLRVAVTLLDLTKRAEEVSLD